MAFQDQRLSFSLVPLMAQGHMLPRIDMARLFSHRGIIVTTPLNVLLFKTIIDHGIQSVVPIRILELPLPSQEAGFPEGYKNLDTLPSIDMAKNFFSAIRMLQNPLEQALAELDPMPISLFPGHLRLLASLEYQELSSIAYLVSLSLVYHNILLHRVHDGATSEESFVVPDFHERIEIKKSQLPTTITGCTPTTESLNSQINEAETNAYGVIVNTFDCLEARYIKAYRKVWKNKVWCIGPVSLCNKERSHQLMKIWSWSHARKFASLVQSLSLFRQSCYHSSSWKLLQWH